MGKSSFPSICNFPIFLILVHFIFISAVLTLLFDLADSRPLFFHHKSSLTSLLLSKTCLLSSMLLGSSANLSLADLPSLEKVLCEPFVIQDDSSDTTRANICSPLWKLMLSVYHIFWGKPYYFIFKYIFSLRYSSLRTLCKFKVHSLLMWYIYILQQNYHCSFS